MDPEWILVSNQSRALLSSLMRSLEAWTAREIAASPVLIDFLRLNDSSEEIRAKVVVIVISHFQKSYGIDLTPEEYFDNLGVKVPQEWIQYGLDSLIFRLLNNSSKKSENNQ